MGLWKKDKEEDKENMVELVIKEFFPHKIDNLVVPTVVLESLDGKHQMLMCVQAIENAISISDYLGGLEPEYPRWSYAIKSTAECLGGKIGKVVVKSLELLSDNMGKHIPFFSAVMVIKKNKKEIQIPVDQQDALVMSLLCGCPYFVYEKVFEQIKTVSQELREKGYGTAKSGDDLSDLDFKDIPEHLWGKC